MGEHGCHFELPREWHAETRHQIRRVLLEPHRAPEGKWVRERQNLGQSLDASAQRLLEQFPLGREETMLLSRGLNGRKEDLGVARLGQKSKDLPMVDRRDR